MAEKTIKAVFINKYGDNSKLIIGDIPKPEITNPNHVLIKVIAASINPVDYKIRQGKVKLILNLPFPIYLGSDCSGIVVDVGKDVSKFKVGDEVYVRKGTKGGNNGTWAEYFLDEEEFFAIKPKNITFDEAASIPLVGLTAYQVMMGKLEKGQKVLITAGAGGVGTIGIQIAKQIIGAEVITTASEKKSGSMSQFRS